MQQKHRSMLWHSTVAAMLSPTWAIPGVAYTGTRAVTRAVTRILHIPSAMKPFKTTLLLASGGHPHGVQGASKPGKHKQLKIPCFAFARIAHPAYACQEATKIPLPQGSIVYT